MGGCHLLTIRVLSTVKEIVVLLDKYSVLRQLRIVNAVVASIASRSDRLAKISVFKLKLLILRR